MVVMETSLRLAKSELFCSKSNSWLNSDMFIFWKVCLLEGFWGGACGGATAGGLIDPKKK